MSFNIPFKFYGNYCGPCYSQGQYAPFDFDVKNPIDAFDETCYIHDRKYTKPGYKFWADWKFFKQNVGRGFLRTAAGLGVLLNPLKYSSGLPGAKGTKRNAKGDGPRRKRSAIKLAKRIDRAAQRLLPVRRARRRRGGRNSTGQFGGQQVVPAPASIGIIRNNKQIPTMRFRHSELLYDQLAGSVGFTASKFSINAGIIGTFPWLSLLAVNWRFYKFNYLAFRFMPSSSTSVAGNVYMAFDYNTLDAVPAQKTQIMNYHHNSSANTWLMQGLDVSTIKSTLPLFVRTGGQQALLGYDLKTYDVGAFFIATQGQANTNAIGDIFVDYEVELLEPNANLGALQSDVSMSGAAGQSNTDPFGTSVSVINSAEESNNPVGYWVAAGGGQPQFQFAMSGFFTIVMDINGTVITPAAGDVALQFAAYHDTLTNEIALVNAGGTQAVYVYYCSVTEGQRLNIIINTATTITTAHLRIMLTQFIN